MTYLTEVKRGEVELMEKNFSEMLHLHTENTERVVKVKGPSGLFLAPPPLSPHFLGNSISRFLFCRSFCETQPIRWR